MNGDEGLWVETIDPHMYVGIALDAAEEVIPVALARELRKLGNMVVWEF